MSDDAPSGGKGATGRSRDHDLSARLSRLETQLDRKRDAASEREAGFERSSSGFSAIGRAFRMSTEFVAGVLAGGLLGWAFDHFLGTKPWGLIVFLMLGFAAGTFNLVRASGSSGSAPSGPGADQRPPT